MSITTIQCGALEYLAAEGISAPHAFTTRLGGVSTGVLASLNIGVHRGDNPENVLENYRILGEAVGFTAAQLVLTRQTHSDIVRTVTRADCGHDLFTRDIPECDALITNDPGVVLVVFTADCTPILLEDTRTGAVGAIHAGWRGTATAIAAKAVQAMVHTFGSRPEDIHAAIGPNIGSCCFQTDADVPDAMRAAFGTEVEDFIRPDGNKYYVNLKAINALALSRAGVNHIEISGDCTACQSARFWSHRITGGARGSQGAVIVCKETL